MQSRSIDINARVQASAMDDGSMSGTGPSPAGNLLKRFGRKAAKVALVSSTMMAGVAAMPVQLIQKTAHKLAGGNGGNGVGNGGFGGGGGGGGDGFGMGPGGEGSWLDIATSGFYAKASSGKTMKLDCIVTHQMPVGPGVPSEVRFCVGCASQQIQLGVWEAELFVYMSVVPLIYRRI